MKLRNYYYYKSMGLKKEVVKIDKQKLINFKGIVQKINYSKNKVNTYIKQLCDLGVHLKFETSPSFFKNLQCYSGTRPSFVQKRTHCHKYSGVRPSAVRRRIPLDSMLVRKKRPLGVYTNSSLYWFGSYEKTYSQHKPRQYYHNYCASCGKILSVVIDYKKCQEEMMPDEFKQRFPECKIGKKKKLQIYEDIEILTEYYQRELQYLDDKKISNIVQELINELNVIHVLIKKIN